MKTLTATVAILGMLLVLTGRPGEQAVSLTHPQTAVAPQAMLAASSLASPGFLPAPARTAPDVSPEVLTGVVQRTCTGCHNEALMTGNLSLMSFDVAAAADNADTAERMIRKLRAGMMPPPGMPRPAGDTLLALVETLEELVDEAYWENPNPGVRLFQRLNRPEYEQAIRDLLALEVQAGDWLPLDSKDANFDNIAAAQALSPLLLEAYLNAASEISRIAVGDRSAPAVSRTYNTSTYDSQHPWDHVPGAPYGTRGGLVVTHNFPADGEYTFGLTFEGGNSLVEDIDISIDGERVALMPYTRSGGGADGRGSDLYSTEPIFVRAGQHRVSAAFVRRNEGPYEDLIRPHDWSWAGGGSGGAGITAIPHLKQLVVGGPYNATGVSDTPSREKIFVCRPTVSAEEVSCAREILTNLATKAYRRPAEASEVDGLMSFYEIGAEQGFEIGIRTALEALLASPAFIFRLESQPENARAGRNFEVADADLASRLSFFLWGTPPDQELLDLAQRGKLSDEKVLEQQARRMLADPRADALGPRFAAQWLRLQDLYKNRPDPNITPNFDENVADAMHRETELFFSHLVREDRSVLDLYTADYTFVNERLARHYGIPGVAGNQFQRVQYPEGDARRGLFGHGSVLVLTSLANRTSPVLRGKWVMEVLLGTPPPPPPPGVPDLEETSGSKDGRLITTRERMEMHRRNPTCNACHQFMDPIGLALDNFDNTAKWRVRENGAPLDTRGTFYDGTPVSNPSELVQVLLNRPTPLLRTFTDNLLAYALGRRVEYRDQPVVRAIVEEAAENDYRISSFIVGVVKSEPFRMKRAEATAADAAESDESRQQ